MAMPTSHVGKHILYEVPLTAILNIDREPVLVLGQNGSGSYLIARENFRGHDSYGTTSQRDTIYAGKCQWVIIDSVTIIRKPVAPVIMEPVFNVEQGEFE
jgi:hypothetical protein